MAPRSMILVVVALGASACSGDAGPATDPPAAVTSTTPTTTAPTAAPLDVAATTSAYDGLSFTEFLAVSYRDLLRRSPQLVTSLGISDDLGLADDRLDDLSDSYLRQTQALEAAILEHVRSYDRATLSPGEQVSYDAFAWHLDRQVRGHPFLYHDYPVHYFLTSYNVGLLRFLTEEHPLDDLTDVEGYLARIEQIAPQVDQVLEGLEIRRKLGIVPPDFVVDWSIATLREDLAGVASSAPRVEALALYTAFAVRTETLELEPRTARDVDERLQAAIRNSFVPAWQRLIAHLESIRPEARTHVGVWALPDGDAYYRWLLLHHTTTDMTAAEVHAMGLEQVERVQAEMRAVFERLEYDPDLPLGAARAKARRDAGFLDGDTAEAEATILSMFDELLAAASRAAEGYFSSAPAAEMIIVPEPLGRGGYYVPGTVDGTRPGAYHAGIRGRGLPRYTMPTILFHEAIPGHHFQIAGAQELDLPEFRRFTRYTAFSEGWALYAERLASEMGLYANDPYGEIGRLELELLRAVRLVTDTGIHSLRWTRDQARRYMIEAMGDQAWTHEVERYVSFPGQATAYMIGQQTMLRLRAEAGRDAGFDIKAFHDRLLGSGALPMAVLEQVVHGPPET